MAAAYSKINDSSPTARQATLLGILSYWVTGTHTRVLGLCAHNIFGSSGVLWDFRRTFSDARPRRNVLQQIKTLLV
jgi:hypothetical protein